MGDFSYGDIHNDEDIEIQTFSNLSYKGRSTSGPNTPTNAAKTANESSVNEPEPEVKPKEGNEVEGEQEETEAPKKIINAVTEFILNAAIESIGGYAFVEHYGEQYVLIAPMSKAELLIYKLQKDTKEGKEGKHKAMKTIPLEHGLVSRISVLQVDVPLIFIGFMSGQVSVIRCDSSIHEWVSMSVGADGTHVLGIEGYYEINRQATAMSSNPVVSSGLMGTAAPSINSTNNGRFNYFVAVTDWNGMLSIFDLTQPHKAKYHIKAHTWHHNAITTCMPLALYTRPLAGDLDPTLLVTGGPDATVNVWHAGSGQKVRALKGQHRESIENLIVFDPLHGGAGTHDPKVTSYT